MEVTIYEQRATELDKRISYLVGLLDNYDPASQFDEYEKVIDELTKLHELERSNASILQEAADGDTRDVENYLTAQQVEVQRESLKWYRNFDWARLAGTVLGLGGLFVAMAFEKHPDGGILNTKFLNPLLKNVTQR